jgi:hypothetical protein
MAEQLKFDHASLFHEQYLNAGARCAHESRPGGGDLSVQRVDVLLADELVANVMQQATVGQILLRAHFVFAHHLLLLLAQ